MLDVKAIRAKLKRGEYPVTGLACDAISALCDEVDRLQNRVDELIDENDKLKAPHDCDTCLYYLENDEIKQDNAVLKKALEMACDYLQSGSTISGASTEQIQKDFLHNAREETEK